MNEQQLQTLLEQMTLDEKAGQLIQLATPFLKGSSDGGQITGPMEGMGINEKVVENTGSVLGASGAKEIKNIQKVHLEQNRLGIPLLFMSDIVHGYKTIFPVPLAVGCSWDLDLAEKSAEAAAVEASVSGIHVTFAPMVDLSRDPRWGRVMESTGEDAYLNSEFARAFVRGFQGDFENDNQRVASCVKHFAAYGAAEGGRDYNTVDMSEWQLRENYLPAYKAALDEGCEMVMTAFNILNGVPSTGNKDLMRELLRKEWGFNGVLISDWGAVKELIPHGVAEDEKEAARKALEAGVDIEMMTECYINHVQNLVSEGILSESLVDEAVLRILKLKQKLGLFDNPYRGADEKLESELILSDNHRATARELAAKSAVLLKNDGALPLKKSQKAALIGPFAESHDILGPWSWLGSKEDTITLDRGIRSYAKDVQIAEGSGIDSGSSSQIQSALKAAHEADVIVLALGESSDMSGEAGSRTDIRLPESQLDLIQELKHLNKPIVTVLFNGRPLDLHGVIDESNAILEAWYPGTEGGQAVADLLYGTTAPSGKLAMSFPQSAGQIPVYYNHYNTGRPKNAPDAQERYVSQYLDSPNGPLFPFGYGLSYTTYSYSDVSLSSQVLKEGETLTISSKVKNTGDVAGEEVVQLYVKDLSGEVVRPVKELKRFERVYLKPGQEKEISFTIDESDLRYYHSNLEYLSDAGDFKVFIGCDSKANNSASFKLVK
ncbi:glycoside hydrolase family 3 N-terminal domain-containing protein [Halobacillus sp. A5]|uniref:glycoside hydrolase family 3 N-terminal domain-containing protein n=1 Tax=Halobacillus sp. A5 TaxID=2880263 RepID=UPI0020A64FEB|nr:glycoside hydrolase family 3 N-terminal domain-containing protein [Halobacillus sp. A5]MCP3029363.1 glycoside hydrolase family 3 C-terminal domain-containing protein [Halobacillus sp. A5]